MKLQFFFSNKSVTLKEELSVYLMSFLDDTSKNQARLVNKSWQAIIEKTELMKEVTPSVHRIKQLSSIPPYQMKIKLLSGGMTNKTIKIKSTDNQWVLRIPGENTSTFINRQDEAYNAKQTSELSLNVQVEFFDSNDGLQLTKFLQNNRSLTPDLIANNVILQQIAKVFLKLHQSGSFANSIDIFSRNNQMLENLKSSSLIKFPFDIEKTLLQLKEIEQTCSQFEINLVPCHIDPTPSNFLLHSAGNGKEQSIKLIDWEYAGNCDSLWDLVYFAMEAKLSPAQENILLTAYFGEVNDNLLAWFSTYKPLVSWWITLWSWTQIANQSTSVDLQSYQKLAELSYNNTLNGLKNIQENGALTVIQSAHEEADFNGRRSLTKS